MKFSHFQKTNFTKLLFSPNKLKLETAKKPKTEVLPIVRLYLKPHPFFGLGKMYVCSGSTISSFEVLGVLFRTVHLKFRKLKTNNEPVRKMTVLKF